MKYFIIIGILFHCSIFSLLSQSNYDNGVLINNKTQVYKTFSRLNSEQFLEKLNNKELKPIKNKASQGLSNAYFWITFSFNQKEKGKNYLLELNSPHIDTAALFLVKNGESTLIAEIGDQIPFSRRQIFHPKILFLFPHIDSSGEYLLLVDKQGGSANFPLYIWEVNRFEYYNSVEMLLWYIFMGALIFFTILSLLFAFIFKKQVFYFYSLFVFVILCYNFITSGFSFAFIYPENTWLNDKLRFLILPAFGISFLLFTKHYFEINRGFPKIENFFRILIFTFIILTFLGLIPNDYIGQHSFILVEILYASLVISSIWIGVVIYNVWGRLKNRAILFLLAFSGNIFVLFYNLLIEFGFIEKSLIRFNPIFIANIQEIILMTFGMYVYIKKIIGERNELRGEKNLLNERDVQIKEQIRQFFSKNTFTSTFLPNEEGGKVKYPYVLRDNSYINLKEVLYIESMDHYLTFYFMDRKVLERKSIKEFLEFIDSDIFIQVHKSFIVNLDYIKNIEANKIILSTGLNIPLSRTYKASFTEKYLKKYS